MNQDTTPRISKEIKRLQAFAAEIRGNGFQVTLPLSTPISRHALTLERIRIVLSSAILDEINETIDRLQALAEYNQDIPEEAPFLPAGVVSVPLNGMPDCKSEVVFLHGIDDPLAMIDPDRAIKFLLSQEYKRHVDAVDQPPSFEDYLLFTEILK